MRRAILLLTTITGAMLLTYAGPVFANHIPPDLAVDYHEGPSKASPGETYVGYRAYIENKGGRSATVPDGTVVAKHAFTGTTSTDCYADTGYDCHGVGTSTVEFVAVGDQTIGAGQEVYTRASATAPTTTGKITHTVTADPNGVIEEIDEDNTSDTIATYVGPPPATDLSLTQTDDADPVYVGDYLGYTVTVTNEGQDTAFNVVVDNTLSANATYDSAYGDDGDCNFIATENTAVCPLGDILSGQSKELTVWVLPKAKGIVSNTATAFNDNGDTEPSNDTAKEETTVQGDGGGGGGGGGGDSTCPTITELRPKKGSETRKRTPLISAEVWDDATDLAQAGTVKLYVDGKRVEGSYDGSTETLSYTPPRKLAYGRHTVRVEATNEYSGGNVPACVSERSWRFSIVRK